jgi:CBS domain-containing protein
VAVTQGRPSTDTVAVVERLLVDHAPIEVVAGLADHYDRVTRDALAQAQADLGPAPVPFAWVALGSHARREPSLSSDQDNALVLADDSPEAAEYGRLLATRVVGALDDAGLRRCDGDYMATTWAFSLRQWEETLRGRFLDPTPQEIVDADVFLDLRPVAGTLDVTPLQQIMLAAAGSSRLLHGLARAAVAFPSGLTSLGRLRLVDGAVDVKKGGLAPLTMLARTYALVAGSTAVGTRDRLEAAEHAGQLSARAAARLAYAHALLTRLRLRHQMRCVQEGAPITDVVPVSRLRQVDEAGLKQALESLKSVQQATSLRFRTDLSS